MEHSPGLYGNREDRLMSWREPEKYGVRNTGLQWLRVQDSKAGANPRLPTPQRTIRLGKHPIKKRES